MSRPVPQGSVNVNDDPRPLLIIPADDNSSFQELAYLDGHRVVTGSEGGTVKVWNLENGGQEGTSMKHESELLGLAVTHDGKNILSSGEEGRVQVWHVESHKLDREWESEGWPRIAISPDDQFVAVGSWTVMKIYSMEWGQINQFIVRDEDEDEDTCVWCMSFSPNCHKLACGFGNDIHVYDVKTGALVLGPLKGHSRYVGCVLWSLDGDRLFSASVDKTIRCWNSNTGEQIGHPWTGHTGEIWSLSLSPDGSILASASWDKAVRLWDATTGDPVGQHLRHDRRVFVVSFSPSGEFVASIDDKMIYLWRVPWWGSVQSQISLVDLGAPRNTVHLAQLSLFHPPPPYSTHIPGTKQVLQLDFDAVTPASNHLTTTALVLDPLLDSLPQDPNTDSPDTSATSDEMGLQYMIPDLSLGLDECQRIFDIRLHKLVELATSKGLRISHDLIASMLPHGVQITSGIESMGNAEHNPMHVFGTEPLTSVFRSAPNDDSKRIRKIDKIKQKLVEMLRDIGFKLSNGRLPWSTLEGDLSKKGYSILNWPHGVVRDRDKGISGLSVEDTDRLHDALFVDERRIQFVPCGEEPARNNDQFAPSSVALSSNRNNLFMIGKQPRFKVTTAAAFIEHARPQKRRRT